MFIPYNINKNDTVYNPKSISNTSGFYSLETRDTEPLIDPVWITEMPDERSYALQRVTTEEGESYWRLMLVYSEGVFVCLSTNLGGMLERFDPRHFEVLDPLEGGKTTFSGTINGREFSHTGLVVFNLIIDDIPLYFSVVKGGEEDAEFISRDDYEIFRGSLNA